MRQSGKEGAGILGLGIAACAACCAGPIVAFFGGIAAVGALSAMFVGVTALVVAALAIGIVLLLRRRRAVACSMSPTRVAVEAPARRHVTQP